jgi:hypothetical protein
LIDPILNTLSHYQGKKGYLIRIYGKARGDSKRTVYDRGLHREKI